MPSMFPKFFCVLARALIERVAGSRERGGGVNRKASYYSYVEGDR